MRNRKSLLSIRNRESLVRRSRTLGDLLALTQPQFEEAITALLSVLGYQQVTVVSQRRDPALTLTCVTPDGIVAAFRCKRCAPDHRIGKQEIESFAGVVYGLYRCQLGLFMTTTSFTEHASTLGASMGLSLIDRDQLTDMMEAAQRAVAVVHE
ncbi:MAG: restriction endonuclease [Acidimicrobiales bacterium]